MKVYSVTASYEDERQGEWTETYAVLAGTPDAAAEVVRSYVADAQVMPASEVTVTVSGEWHGDTRPRIVASLNLDLNDQPIWRDFR